MSTVLGGLYLGGAFRYTDRQAVGLRSEYKESRPVSTGAAAMGPLSRVPDNLSAVIGGAFPGQPPSGRQQAAEREPPPCIIPEAFLWMLDSRAVQYPGLTVPYGTEYYRQRDFLEEHFIHRFYFEQSSLGIYHPRRVRAL